MRHRRLGIARALVTEVERVATDLRATTIIGRLYINSSSNLFMF